MTRKILVTLATIGVALFVFVLPHSAQENPQGTVVSGAEKARSNFLSVYSETMALLDFLGEYESIRQSEAMKNYPLVRRQLSEMHDRIGRMSPEQVTMMSRELDWLDEQFVNRVTKLSRQIRTDVRFQAMVERVEKNGKASIGRPQSVASETKRFGNSRGVIAAPAYIPPNCNYDDPSDYPSGVDLGIAGGVQIALKFAADLAPSEYQTACTMVPNPIHIAFAIAAGVADLVKIALEALAADAGYCEKVRLFVEDKLKDDRGLTTILMNDDFYLTFMLKSVRASLATATTEGVATNCGSARLTAASAFFDGSDNFIGANGTDRVSAYRILRAAYQNIGAASCVQ
ncbi:MAG: hypothetical protein SF097_08830 [Acidobacteriota bacterium]|nr:hypothetical protein [Acidobacteriota bacterium]